MKEHQEIEIETAYGEGERHRWVNFYEYSTGQKHPGITICDTLAEARGVRVAYMLSVKEIAEDSGLAVAFNMSARAVVSLTPIQAAAAGPEFAFGRDITKAYAVPYRPEVS